MLLVDAPEQVRLESRTCPNQLDETRGPPLQIGAVRDAELEVGVADRFRPRTLEVAHLERQGRGRQAALITRSPDVVVIWYALARLDVVLAGRTARLPAGLAGRRNRGHALRLVRLAFRRALLAGGSREALGIRGLEGLQAIVLRTRALLVRPSRVLDA